MCVSACPLAKVLVLRMAIPTSIYINKSKHSNLGDLVYRREVYLQTNLEENFSNLSYDN